MACKQHPDRESVAICVTCRDELCDECRRVGSDGRSYCAQHLPAAGPQPEVSAEPAPPTGAQSPLTATGAPSNVGGVVNEVPVLAALCYLCWLVPPLSFLLPVVVLTTDYRTSRYMRLHAYQGLFWGIAVLVVAIALRLALVIAAILGLPSVLRLPLGIASWVLVPRALVVSVVFALKANNREDLRIPVVTDLATKQVG